MISITSYKSEYFDALSAYHLNEEQSQFCRIPKDVLKDPDMLDNNQCFLYCILVDEAPAGFFCLDFSNNTFDYSHNLNAVLLRSLSVNPVYQGKGVAKAAMLQLPTLIKKHFPSTTEIVFGVNANNKNAYWLYLKTGYLDSGKIYDGIKGPQYVMYMRIGL